MVNIIKLISNVHPSGQLVVLESGANIPLDIRRVFVVTGKKGAIRGKHAHRRLTQILVCVHGTCRVICDDGQSREEVVLDRPDIALKVPPGVWAEQTYSEEDTVLMVLCDLPFEEDDYIRDYNEFLAFSGRVNK